MEFRGRGGGATIFITTRVNYGEKPGVITAIAAVRETAERFGEGREKAAKFLKNCTYVDDTTGGAEDMEGVPGHGGYPGEWRIPFQRDRHDRGSFGRGRGAKESMYLDSGGTQKKTRFVWM
jgi:hypothetical protein